MEPIDARQQIVDNLVRLLAVDQDKTALKTLLHEYHPADIAEAMGDLADDRYGEILQHLEPQIRGEILDEASEDEIEEFIEQAEFETLVETVEEMQPDEAADILEQIDNQKAEAILTKLSPEHAEDIRELREYDSDSAGGIMNNEFFWVNPEIEVIDIINRLKTEQEEVENVREIIVCRDDMKLEGIIKVEDLLAAEDTAKAQTVMEKATISVGANVDQELCVRYISKYDLTILPVLDNRRRILGLITVDDIIDVMEDEASEDMYRLVGVGADKPLFESPLSRALKRLPWFIVTIIGMSFLSLVMQRFEGTLKAVVGLAFFVPAVMAIGGTVGIQASTITVRGLATNELEFKNLWWLIKRELMVGVIIGLVCASLMGISSYGIMKLGIRTDQPTLSHSTTITSTTSPKQASTAKPNPVTDIFKFSLTVGLSLFLSVLGSIILGTSIPMICHRLGADPALAAGPFITTLVDVGSQIIYLSMATWLLLAS